ncbi:MAG: ABC transporter ATP-binding protein [Clostridia bacterium]|nr:ABC transporter ATP-binding protein [Clostridia bacterium]
MKLDVSELSLAYFGHLPSLNGISATFQNGVNAILGTNGSGKTSLLKAIAGLERHEGKVLLDDADVTMGRNIEVGLVFDDLGLFERRSVLYNVTYPLRVRHIPKSEWASHYEPALKKWGLQDLFMDTAVRRLPDELRVRLALARAWTTPRKVLLLDDPLSCLAPDERARTFELLSLRMRERSGITIYATDHQGEVRSLEAPTLLLSNGYALGQDTLEKLTKVKCAYQGEALIPHYHLLDGECKEGQVHTDVLEPFFSRYPSSYEGQKVLVGLKPQDLEWEAEADGSWQVKDKSMLEGVRYAHVQKDELILTLEGTLPLGEKGGVKLIGKPALFDVGNELRIDRQDDGEDIR